MFQFILQVLRRFGKYIYTLHFPPPLRKSYRLHPLTFYDSGVIVYLTLQIFPRRPLTKDYKESANTKQYNTEKYILLAGFEPAMPGLGRQKNIFRDIV